ncbi:insecticidal delta-endotoxin Cry8Ea1 family protein [Photobacterium damselae subsp. piscicida]|nr:insecticidal delta-endotoxin Cry8Ea1 family protein [Photobacterium damselae subsp. piscicida]
MLSFLVHLLWPSSQKDIWEEIREKVEKLINQKLSEDTYERLKQVLEGLEGVLKQYLKTIQAGASDDEIKIHFLAANLFFINQRPWFQQKNHEYVLYPLFSIFASLHLTLLRDGLINGKHLFSNNEYELLKKDMKEYTKSYSDYLLKTVDAERYKLKEHSPPVGQHKTEYYNYFADFNAVTIKYCDDYIEMFRQMDVDLNPQAFEFN